MAVQISRRRKRSSSLRAAKVAASLALRARDSLAISPRRSAASSVSIRQSVAAAAFERRACRRTLSARTCALSGEPSTTASAEEDAGMELLGASEVPYLFLERVMGGPVQISGW